MAKFYGIGVGPGDPELLTLKAVRILKSIDVLLIPQTKREKKGVAHRIIESFLKDEIELVYSDFPMVSEEKSFEVAGKKAAQIIEDQVAQGKNVAFVTLGDPSVYSTYGYILKALDQAVEVETIPGITSFCAAAAMTNRPLVEKNEILSIIPMNAEDDKIDQALAAGDAFAFMKLYKREERLINHLKQHQMEKDALLVQRCGFPEAIVHRDGIKGLMENDDYLTLILSRKK